ncbi:Crp/Fnr family transcriptional regulator [Stappia sp. F7233]|uniref:Crp/Fnr family transcriptional regulator n=1 Tax=Stappia albiluteola TaxID=2758565 RepID=A0A839AA30_9HYPH|nr:Crp/Fnr family transcriptional regulator [Stappia albiluteola]MBA5775975.1 Crp/Fnr family transcriptional regulator [Stappia albiluteola]
MHTLSTFKKKLETFSPIPQSEFDTLVRKLGKPKVLEAREELRFEHGWPHRSYLVAEGWACTVKQLNNGSRQILDIAIAGDIIGARGMLLRNVNYCGQLLTPSIVYELSSRTIFDLLDSAPRLAAALMWSLSRDDAILIEHFISIGRRTAAERVLHFFLELKHRLQLIGKCNGNSYACPLSQGHIADALGLTPAHLNRVIRDLREDGILNVKDGTVEILDPVRAAALCGHDPRYLDHQPIGAEGRKRAGC